MGKCCLELHQPLPYGNLPAVLLPSTKYFVVTGGKQSGVTTLKAHLINPDTGAPLEGKVLNPGMYWAVLFDGLTSAALAKYRLIVLQNDDATPPPWKYGNRAVTAECTVGPGHGGYHGTIPISYPGANETASSMFIAYGAYPASGIAPTEATMHGSGPIYQGSPVPGMPANFWAFQFSNLADDTYTFEVDNAPAGGDSGSVNNVTVNSGINNPPVAPDPPPPGP